jgi:crotonobetainyl-CoA:carnitine CoA-transferase CaiB-like acyl-CoA transferase
MRSVARSARCRGAPTTSAKFPPTSRTAAAGDRGHAPRLGEQSVELLRSVGYSDGEIAGMIDDGITVAA